MFYKKQLRKKMIKSAMIITFLLCFALLSTYLIYQMFQEERDKKISSPSLEVTFHEKEGSSITLSQFHPVSDSVGLSQPAYTFTVRNATNHKVSYKIELLDDLEKIKSCNCESMIPKELLKLSVRKDSQVADAVLLSDYENQILRTDTLNANEKEEYTIRIWPVNSTFVVDSKSHYHGKLRVREL